jgi:hypothetical protein
MNQQTSVNIMSITAHGKKKEGEINYYMIT